MRPLLAGCLLIPPKWMLAGDTNLSTDSLISLKRKSVSRHRVSAGIPPGDSEHCAQVDTRVRSCAVNMQHV